MRFMAAFLVVIRHARMASFAVYHSLVGKNFFSLLLFAATKWGPDAVVFFFVLSGFLVGGRTLERIADGRFRPAHYAVDRVVRIMLPLVPALALTAVIDAATRGGFNVVNLLGNIVSLQGVLVHPFGGNLPLWSLAYEWWFYVLAWAIGIAAARRSLQFQSAGLLVATAAVFTALSALYLFCWLIGAFAYVRRARAPSLPVLLFSLALCLVGLAGGQAHCSFFPMSARAYFPTGRISIIILATGLALLIQQAVCAVPRKLFLVKLDVIGTRLAASSYSLYLSHFPVLQLMVWLGVKKARHVGPASIGIYLSLIAMCLIVSWFLYLLFERHTNFFRQMIKERIRVLQPSETGARR